jgi:hypothetical protein
MQKDLNMTDVQWSAGISLFYGQYIPPLHGPFFFLSKKKS